MKKFITILLCALLLVSCGTEGDVSTEISQEMSEEVSEEQVLPKDPLSILPDGDFDGDKTVIWTTDLALTTPDNAYDSSLKKIMQERIDSIENKFNTEIVIEQKTSAEITEAVKTGENCPDLVIMPSTQSSMNSVNGYYANLWSLPYFSTAAKTLGGAAEEQTINNSLYMMTAPFLFAQQNTLVVYANRDLITEAGLRSPAYAVADGTWNTDKMLEYIAAASTVAGKPSADIEKDIFGFASVGLDTDSLINVLWNGSGIDYFGKTMGKPLRAEFDYEAGKQATAAVKNLINSGTRFTATAQIEPETLFRNGKSVFCVTYFTNFMGENLITEFDWEILPLPMNTTTQQTYSSTITEAMCISVPAAKEDSHRAGLILSAWILASHEIEDTLLQYYITYSSTDNVNTYMMSTVFDTVHYTLTELYSSIYDINSVGRKLIATSVTDTITLETYIRWQDTQMDITAEKFK